MMRVSRLLEQGGPTAIDEGRLPTPLARCFPVGEDTAAFVPVRDALYQGNLDLLTELTSRWKADGHLPQDADSDAAARIVFALMQGLLVCHHLGTDVSLPDLTRGLTALGAGLEPR
jgi:hypothetical protein